MLLPFGWAGKVGESTRFIPAQRLRDGLRRLRFLGGVAQNDGLAGGPAHRREANALLADIRLEPACCRRYEESRVPCCSVHSGSGRRSSAPKTARSFWSRLVKRHQEHPRPGGRSK